MAQKLEQGSIVFIDVPTQLPDLSSSKGTLLPLLDLIRRYIETLRGATPTLLIFDELALFGWIGHSELDVSRFSRALVSSSVKVSCEQPDPLPPIDTDTNSRMTFSWSYDITLLHPTTSTTLCGYCSNSPHTISKSSHWKAGRVVPSVVRCAPSLLLDAPGLFSEHFARSRCT